MARNSIVGGGDYFARGGRKAQFSAGGAKKGEKVQINKGTLMSEADRKALDKVTIKDVEKAPARIKSKWIPMFDRILVRPATVEEKSAGGLYIPNDAKERPREGVIVWVGEGQRNSDGVLIPMSLKPDDYILFGQYAGTEVKIDNELVLMMRESEVLAKRN